MIYDGFQNNYLLSLIDVSENIIKEKLYMDGFAHHQFLLVDSYGYAISQEKVETRFTPGDVIYVAAGRAFGIRCEGEMRVKYIAFSGNNIRPLLHYCRFDEFRITTPLQKEKASQGFDKIFEIALRRDNDRSVDASEALYSLLCLLGEANIENDNYVFDRKSLLVHPVYDFMHANYRSPALPYKEILASLGMTKENLDDLFLDVFTMTADDFFMRMRMQDSQHLLFFYRDYGVRYVAENMGYANEEEFRSDFYNEFKITPENFLKLYF